MILKRPKPIHTVESLVTKAALSSDPEIRQGAERTVLDCLADSVANETELDLMLAQIPDEEQRRAVRERVRPLLGFILTDPEAPESSEVESERESIQ